MSNIEGRRDIKTQTDQQVVKNFVCCVALECSLMFKATFKRGFKD